MTLRAASLYLLVVALSVLAFAYVVPPMGFAPNYGQIGGGPAQPEPATRAVVDCEALETMPRAKGARPGISNLAMQPPAALPCGGLI